MSNWETPDPNPQLPPGAIIFNWEPEFNFNDVTGASEPLRDGGGSTNLCTCLLGSVTGRWHAWWCNTRA